MRYKHRKLKKKAKNLKKWKNEKGKKTKQFEKQTKNIFVCWWAKSKNSKT